MDNWKNLYESSWGKPMFPSREAEMSARLAFFAKLRENNNPFVDTPLSSLPLSARSLNALTRTEYTTAGEVMWHIHCYGDSWGGPIRNFGDKSQKETEDLLNCISNHIVRIPTRKERLEYLINMLETRKNNINHFTRLEIACYLREICEISDEDVQNTEQIVV